jgi:enamine deaminase RidA (YjgF/YER057c/UK114 family)
VARGDKKPPAGRANQRPGPGRTPPPPAKPAAAPTIEQPTMRRRLALLGIHLPEVKPPAFHYVPVVVHGGIAYVSGQLPWQGSELGPLGKVEREVGVEQAQDSARRCALQALAWLNQTLTGGLDEVERALRVTGYVASSPGFDQQPKVIDAASELLVKVFGHAGQHARAAIGVAELPRNVPVEIEFTFALKRRPSPAQRHRRPGFPVVEMR